MLFDQIAKERPEGVALFLFRQGTGNIARNRICSSGADFLVNPRKLMLRQADGDFRPGHTAIIPTMALAKCADVLARLPPEFTQAEEARSWAGSGQLHEERG